ncbi:MAG TPA: aminoacyl-tRNA hydrolase [Gemmatimonadaceae bacterium]|jgi:PTH1 family peptidyl-tRNA hydrolase|nr:aminoacyl-tRNA hydrolase [Gemmatimonadaceae bacterium]
MKVILGLGNPGKEYEHTRHNVGWWLTDHLAERWAFDGWKKDGQARVAQGHVPGVKETVRLVKPQTYMNLSGNALVQYARRPFWTPTNDLLVLVDDVAIPAGTWRLRAEGGAGGHNGLKSVQQSLGTQQYPRLRIGVGDPERPPGGPLTDFVLGPLGKRDAATVRELFPIMTDAIDAWIRGGIKPALDVQSRAKSG